MEPLVINEKLVSLFKFWFDGQIYDGMGCRNEIFSCLRVADHRKRQQIYDLGWALAEEGVQVVITVSDSKYTLWSNLRYLEQSTKLLEQPTAPTHPSVCVAC
ncbi:hypothetical protein [Pseudanabaena sp. FACHB-2040]|uniref:hypothetical protein n=1 Tax=Pseudanabaena sp. FACHB-2040 TaxID=2692859 RepID=UPI0016861EE6|nr:hypothetical protein [Pseudanabaena sp. FACHB-2040]MBD2256096.1 hypothetical protein [Pseudanabaena sp. FACHB-2040]